ncbi:hypothetical protein ACLOJK_008932 [Asimina triloba]
MDGCNLGRVQPEPGPLNPKDPGSTRPEIKLNRVRAEVNPKPEFNRGFLLSFPSPSRCPPLVTLSLSLPPSPLAGADSPFSSPSRCPFTLASLLFPSHLFSQGEFGSESYLHLKPDSSLLLSTLCLEVEARILPAAPLSLLSLEKPVIVVVGRPISETEK